MEAAMKLARQYFLEKSTPEPQRTIFISRRQSYHGITLGALSLGGHVTRRAKFEPLLKNNVSQVSPCFAYRGKRGTESDTEYVARLIKELDDEFQRVGPDSVIAFVAEPVVGAVCSPVLGEIDGRPADNPTPWPRHSDASLHFPDTSQLSEKYAIGMALF